MSRFDGARRGRIAVWTGAALAWGTAVTLAGQEPAQAGADDTGFTAAVETQDIVAPPVPAMPEKGLVVIRYQPSVTAPAEVLTVYVRQSAPQPAASAPAPAPPAPSAPAPRSGGS